MARGFERDSPKNLGGGTEYPLSHDWTSDGVTWINGFTAWDSEVYSKAQYRLTEFATFYILEYRGAPKVPKDILTSTVSGTDMIKLPTIGTLQSTGLWFYGSTSRPTVSVGLHGGTISMLSSATITSNDYFNFYGQAIIPK